MQHSDGLAAGMIGRKLADGSPRMRARTAQPIDTLTLIDVVAPAKPAFAGGVETATADLSVPGAAAKAVAARPT